MKFSIIIPVFNVDAYLKKCLDSVLNQTYENFEIILINDGSTDNSGLICKEYVKKDNRIIYFEQENSGLSVARNNGVLKSNGDYLLFLDSDDYLENELLEVLNKELDREYDLIRFGVEYDKNKVILKTKGASETKTFDNGIEAFNEIVEDAWCYLYNRNYYIKNKFKFMEKTLHEDFGLIPLVIIKGCNIKCINYIGYNYVIRENSIMTSNDYEKILKKARDFLIHFKFLLKESNKINGDLSIFKSFIANSCIIKSTTLKGIDYKNYLKKLKELKAFDMLLDDTLTRKIKKILIKISPKIYYKVIGGLK